MTGGNLEVFDAGVKGRGLKATRELHSGEVVFSEPTYAAVVFDSLVSQVCHNCFRHQTNLHRCAQCRFAHYCDRTCQTACWEEHKQECAAIRSSGFTPNENIRLAARVLWRRKKDQGLASDSQLVAADLLEDHLDLLPEGELKKVLKDVDSLLRFWPGTTKQNSTEFLSHILGLIRNNGFRLKDQRGLQDVGLGIFPSLGLLNHNCWPSCTVTFNHGNQSAVSSALHSRKRMELRALRTIPEGEEVTIGYVDFLNLSADRQKQLKERFYFDCSCERCSRSISDELMSAAAETKPPAEKVKEVTAFSKESLEKIEKARDAGDHSEVLKLCQECLEKQEGVVANTHLSRLCVLSVASQVLSHLKKFSEAAELTQKMVEGYIDEVILQKVKLQDKEETVKHGGGSIMMEQKLYHPNNAQLGMALMRAGVTYWHAGQVEEGHKMICEAYRILMITHGSNHSITKDLESMRTQTEMELKTLKENDLNMKAAENLQMTTSSSAEENVKGFLRKQ